jgi:hypothetical protein
MPDLPTEYSIIPPAIGSRWVRRTSALFADECCWEVTEVAMLGSDTYILLDCLQNGVKVGWCHSFLCNFYRLYDPV